MKTAVEWLEQEFIKLESTIGIHGVMYELLEQAKVIEKQQIINAYRSGKIIRLENSEIYYNETFNK